MSKTIAPSGFTQEAFDAFLRSRHEPAWLTDQRRDAWDLFLETPMPDSQQEEWRRTDLRLFRLDQFVSRNQRPTSRWPKRR